ncbi:MAG: peptidoglycan DD-metalloendopeptidase family protein [Chlorobi bacterium]|nr:peptidoglycan DD-metalloendopeptidase family protein [Chlorobiota bacterium]
MEKTLKKIFPSFLSSTLNSYSQIFFSNDKIFASILVLVSFFDLNAGISGLMAVMASNAAAYLIGFNRNNIIAGYYGFNSLLVGLGLGIYYQMSPIFLMVLLFAAIFTLFITIMLEGVIGKYGLPYLSISFLLGIWMVTLASRQFSELTISEKGIYMSNEIYSIGGYFFVGIYNWFNNLNLHESVVIYFRSLGAIFFQYHLFAGVLIAIGLLIYSRIAFLLSLVGFFGAYLFYKIVGGNLYELSYAYIGFNYILTSIAIGGFFIVPSRFSFLWVIFLIPLISITITSTIAIFDMFQLSIFSLPFNFIVLMFLYIMKFRERFYHNPEIVSYQQFSPEKNLYFQLNNKERFNNFKYIPVALPFWGEWKVTQGHYGDITHRDKWAHAWDFEIIDDEGLSFKEGGTVLKDYFCYNKPVIAPADGWVEEVLDGVEDNDIGDSNLEQNWGNTIILKIGEKVYCKMSHLKPNSFKVKKGDTVKKGDILAACGNSGRSPIPHIHFQMQETPYIGSETLNYPIGNYVQHLEKGFEFKSYDKPRITDMVSNIEKDQTLYKAYHFVPGQVLKFSVSGGQPGTAVIVKWEVQTDIYNNSYLYCKETNSKAWFKNDGSIHYFTLFEGDRSSVLFYFFLGNYKVISGFYKGMTVKDVFPIHVLNKKAWILLQDFIAPFYMFMKSEYRIEYVKIKKDFTDSKIELNSTARVKRYGKTTREVHFKMEIEAKSIQMFEITEGNKTIVAKRITD